MKIVCTAEESRGLDKSLIEHIGVPGIALMETASRGLARAILKHHAGEAANGVVVVCGPGNNGGDGYGTARWLRSWGVDASTCSLAEASRGDAGIMRAAAKAAGVPEVDGIGRAGLIVDAVFGTGLTREVTGRYAEVLRRMDSHPSPVVAADLPSGLDADLGRVHGVAVEAVRTVTFGAHKRGLFGVPGQDLAGEVEVVDLGIHPQEVAHGAVLMEAADLVNAWPRRSSSDHKTRSGHLLVIAGSAQMAGAAVLCCRGALAAGAGLVTLLAPRGAWPRLASLPPEVMVVPAGDGDVAELTRVHDLDRYTAVVAGPGLGGGEALPPHTEMTLAGLWSDLSVPLLLDADALSAVQGGPGGPRVITPHPGEAARLLECGTAEVQGDRFGAVERLATPGVTVLLKGRHTLVAERRGPISVNPTGAASLATGGSGDVLAGFIGALLARGVLARDSARLGAWLHGRAGQLLAERRTTGHTASDIADVLPSAVEELLVTGDRPAA